ncbi:MAG TPA: DinB family protein [Flavobacteriaceae bacterium]|nr:DinB family protein [Flavobacteriaceae bacterium]
MNQFQISPEYAPYYRKYIDLVTDISLIEALSNGEVETLAFFKAIPKEKQEFRYAEGKWSPKQVLLHLIDTERVFAYPALQFARADDVEIKGYDQNIFADNSNADERSWNDLLEEYQSVRAASLNLFKSFQEAILKRYGKVDGDFMSVRAAGTIICGHEIHHRNIVRERYL